MKSANFRRLALLMLLILASSAVDARHNPEESGKEKSIPAYVPRTITMQYAGNIGAVSAGLEWRYGKNSRWETSLLAGYIPRYHTSCAKATLTLKQRFTPFCKTIGEKISCRPLECGIFLNSILSDEFWVKEPSKYPKGYYGFATKVRINIFIGQRYDFILPPSSNRLKSMSLYYELSTSDFHLLSYFPNSDYLGLSDLFCLGVGLKLNFE